MELTSFDKDFSNVVYGQVQLNVEKKIAGNRTFLAADGRPTVRNLGNTLLNVRVAQDDMFLGQSSGISNVFYNARVGNLESDWVNPNYPPFKFLPTAGNPISGQYTTLAEVLNLSEIEEIDFSVLVNKWPTTATSFNGNMWMNAISASWPSCS